MSDGTVKIGDFGLSRNNNMEDAAAAAAPGGGAVAMGGGFYDGDDDGEGGHDISPPPTPVAGPVEGTGEGLGAQAAPPAASEITSGIGTLLYASPEQTAGGDYDSKTDIYSLGIMLFEMCHPAFGTGMERAIVLRQVCRALLSSAACCSRRFFAGACFLFSPLRARRLP